MMTGIRDRNQNAGAAAPRVCTITLSRSLAARLAVYGTALLFFAVGIVLVCAGRVSYKASSLSGLAVFTLVGIVTYVATLLVHEGIHGLFFGLFGGRPRFGAGMITWFLPYAYAASPGDRYTLLQMSVISLAPFFWISVLSLLAMSIWPAVSTYAGIAFVGNFSGAIGDLWLVRQIWRFHGCRDVRFVDERDALGVYSVAPVAQVAAAAFAASENGTRVGRFILRWLAASVAILISAFPMMLVTAVLEIRKLTIGMSQFVLLKFENPPQAGMDITFGYWSIIGAGFLFAALCFLFERSKPPAPDESEPKGSPHPVVV